MRFSGRVMLALVALITCAILAEPPKRPAKRSASGFVALNPTLLRVVWAGFRPFAADFYWVRTAEQMGAANTAEQYRDVGIWANLATDLDPRFRLVYEFGAVAMPFNLGRNTWVNGDESTALLRKGLKVFPDDYNLQFFLAHNLIFYDHDYVQAGEVLRRLSERPNAPAFLAQLATRVMAQGGEIDSAIDFARSGAANAKDDETRQTFEERIKQLETERELQRVDKEIAAFKAREGRLPTTINEMLIKDPLFQMPMDPSGGEISIDRKGRARSTSETRRLEITSSEQKQIDAEEEAAEHANE